MQRTVGHLQAQLDHFQAKYTGLQDSHAELQLKQDDLQAALERLADLTGTADTWGIRAASFGMRLDQPCFHGLVILFSGLSAQVFAIPFLPAVDTVQYGPQGTITDWPVLDQDLNRVDPEYLNSLPQAPHLAPTERWELEKYYDYLDAVHTEGGNRQRLARMRAGVRIPTQFIPGVPLGDIPYVRVGLKRGTIVKVIWPTLAFAPNLTHTGMGQGVAGVGQAPPGALAAYLTAAAAPPPSPQGGWNLPPALLPAAQAAALVPAHPNPRLGGGGAEGAVTRSGAGPSTSAGRELTTDVRLEPPKVRRVDFNSPGGGQDLFRMFQDAPLSSIREDGGQITTHRRIGGTRDDPTPYLDPNRPRSPLRAGLPARPVITQGALELTVAGLREELTDMRSAMKLDRMNRNPLNAPAVKENLARHTALLAAVNRAPQGATVYQREDKPVPVWAGKDSAAVPDRAVWFQRAVVKAQRQGVPLLDYLQDVTAGSAKIWVDNLLNRQSEYILQQSLMTNGGMTYHDSTGLWMQSGRPVALVEDITDTVVVTDFSRHFMTNLQDKADQAKVALFRGTACVQGPSDTVGDYLIAFQAACWTVKYDRTADPFHTITLINGGLKPALQKLGFLDKHGGGKVFPTEEKYVEFLMAEECKAAQYQSAAGSTQQTTFPLASNKPFYPQTAGRVHMLTEDDTVVEDLLDRFDEEADYDDEGELEEDVEGMVCGIRQGKPRPRNDRQSGGYRGKSGGAAAPARDTVSVTGPRGESLIMPKRDFALPFIFPLPTDVWPEGFTFTTSMIPANPPFSLGDRILKAVSIMNPSMSMSRVFGTLARVTAQSPTWQWCMIHGCTAHSTRDCPCVHQLCPRPSKRG
jgi:hypothetical protein